LSKIKGFKRLSTEVLSLVPSVTEITSLFYEPDYPSDFLKSLPPLAEIDKTTSSSKKKLSGGTKDLSNRHQRNTNMSIRSASHAGSWYENDGNRLGRELEEWLNSATAKSGSGHPAARAIIGPHAGYKYCGACGGYAYSRIDPKNVKRVFILGPSHHVRLNGCAVSGCVKYATPIYDLNIDRATNEELLSTGSFEVMSLQADEDEHSIEMHLPYLAKVMQSQRDNFTVVPILVGSLSPDREVKYGRIFAKYLADPSNLFIISSDFCHWGKRFRYQEYDQSKGQIHESIKALDFEGMEIIESLNHEAFSNYLKNTGNTICGRHPIGVFLGAVNALRGHLSNGHSNGINMQIKFLNYDQSNACRRMDDSSVSYAAAVFTLG